MTETTTPQTHTATTGPDDELATLNQRWGDAFNAGDVAAMMAFYEPDAIVVPGPGAPPIQGRAAIEAALEAFLALGGGIEATAPHYWIVNGDLALGSVSWVIGDAGAPDAVRGTTTELARRQPDGTWRYVVDHPFGGSVA